MSECQSYRRKPQGEKFGSPHPRLGVSVRKRQPGLGRCPQMDETQTDHCLALHGFCTLAPGRCPQTSRTLWSGVCGSTRTGSAPLRLWVLRFCSTRIYILQCLVSSSSWDLCFLNNPMVFPLACCPLWDWLHLLVPRGGWSLEARLRWCGVGMVFAKD